MSVHRTSEHQTGVARALADATSLTAYDEPERMVLALRVALAHAEALALERAEMARAPAPPKGRRR